MFLLLSFDVVFRWIDQAAANWLLSESVFRWRWEFFQNISSLLKHHAQGLFWKLQEIEVYVFFKIS